MNALNPRLTRALAALPDAVTAAFFLVVWIAPLSFGEHGVRNAMLIMLVEFFLVHATGMLGALAFGQDRRRTGRMLGVLALAPLYLTFIALFAYLFEAWWPFLAFGWLLLGKLWIAFDSSRSHSQRHQQMQVRWATTALVYIAGVLVTAILPLPRLGMSADLVPRFGLPGSGLWVEQPHTVIAFGVFYFSVLAWNNWREAPPAGAR